MIDDDREMCQEMAEVLQDEGYIVKTAFDGLEGKNLIEREDCDLLLLDLKIPKLTGFDILKKAKDGNDKLKVIILTGKPIGKEGLLRNNKDINKDEEEVALELADSVMNKPFDIEKVLSKIKELTSV